MQGTHQQPTSRELCRRCGDGDEAAFREVYGMYATRLYGTALRMLADPAAAEDATQEAFLTFHRKAARLNPTNLGGWLHRVLVNECLDRLRRRGRRGEDELYEELHGRPARPVPAAVDLERAVGRLPERARLVFLLHDVEGLKHREIAELLEIAPGTSKSQLFRAREMLRSNLSGAVEEDPEP